MIKKIINIDRNKCVGCGLCADACAQSVIEINDGKAELVRADYCDGLGNCLPVCPVGAINFIEKEADVQIKKAKEKPDLPCGCPGTNVVSINSDNKQQTSELRQWPIQIKLVPTNAAFFQNCDLLVCADCTAYAHANFHNDFIKGKTTVIGCPKLDNTDYSEKLTDIIKNNNIKSVTVVRMEVPCCSGLERAVKTAVNNSGKDVPCNVKVISHLR